METALNSIRPVTLREQVFEEIQRAILEKRLEPGDHIREQELTKLLNVSRTPVREALVLLERDGLVQISPNRGCFVREFGVDDIREIFVMRTGLENLAAKLIVHRLTDGHIAHLDSLIQQQIDALAQPHPTNIGMLDLEFHKYLVCLAGNSRLLRTWQVIAMQYTMIFNYLHRAHTYHENGKQQIVVSHQAILEGLRHRDAEQVAQVNWETNDRIAALCIRAYLAQNGET